jgi:molybdate transport system substrate-binding protein
MLGTLAGCGGSESGTVDVFAASSYTDVAVPLEALIETALDVDVRFTFGSSSSFFEQLDQGAPASVVLTANTATMQRLEQAGLVSASVPITSNELIIVTADSDAGRRISTLSDLGPDSGAVVVLCASSAPCGEATDLLLVGAGVSVAPASREPNVRATLTKVLLGEADAAIVYRSDAVAHPELRSVEIPEAVNVSVTGRAAAVAGDEVGREIVELLAGPESADTFRRAGFEVP